MKYSKVIFIFFATLALAGVLTYLRLAFQGADVKTAVRLVEEAKVAGRTLRERMEPFLPAQYRLCEARVLDKFYGHMEVICRDVRGSSREIRWKVNVADGMVVPEGAAAVRLGEGKSPWN